MEKVKNAHCGTAYKKNICGLNAIEVIAGTTGYCGGDSGHGGRTYFSIRDIGGTDIEVNVDTNRRGFEVKLGGDAELESIFYALQFIAGILNKEMARTNSEQED